MKLAETGLEIVDLDNYPAFAERQLRARHVATPVEGVNRLARVLVDAPERILQELVEAAVDLCGADSAGISLETRNGSEDKYYEWVATAGEYAKFLHAMLPRVPSACGTCLERGKPQHFRVSQRFFDLMGVRAAEVTDGILLPWHVNQIRGTIWILAHGRTEAFDQDDVRIMHVMANIAAMGVRQQESFTMPMKKKSMTGGNGANDLARRFDQSLQNLRTTLHLAGWSQKGSEASMLAEQMAGHLKELSALVNKLLRQPEPVSRPN